jgi:hypothetical protein
MAKSKEQNEPAIRGLTEEQAVDVVNVLVSDMTPRRCRNCGCSDDRACPGGCYWIEDDLCSRCEEIQS